MPPLGRAIWIPALAIILVTPGIKFFSRGTLSVGFGLQPVPDSPQHLPRAAQTLLPSGPLPAAGLSFVLNLGLPEDI